MNLLVPYSTEQPIGTCHFPPIHLGYLADAVISGNTAVEIVDALKDRLSPQQVREIVDEINPDVIGLSCMTSDYEWVKDFCNLPNKSLSQIIIGGPHATALPELTLRETQADWVVRGEGEDLLRMLVCAPPSVFIHGDQILGNIKPPEIGWNWPEWRLIDPRWYHLPQGGVTKRWPVAPIATSRGCPYECTFCASPLLHNRTIRYRGAEDVVEEMTYLMDKFEVKEFNIIDDNFTAKTEHAGAICELMIKRGLNATWSCENGIRADRVEKGLLALMKRAGCYRVAFGVESPNQKILENIKKKGECRAH